MVELTDLRARYEELLRALPPKQALFVQEYLIDLNQTQAAIRAGYSEKTATAKGAQLYALPRVRAAIDAGMALRAERTEITQDWVVQGLKEVAERCLQRAPVMAGEFQERDEEGRHVWQFNAPGANKALELLGKHLGMFNKIEVSGPNGGPIQQAITVEFVKPKG